MSGQARAVSKENAEAILALVGMVAIFSTFLAFILLDGRQLQQLGTVVALAMASVALWRTRRAGS